MLSQEESSTEERRVEFSELGLSASILEAVKDAGFEKPSEIQVKTIPVILAGSDIIGQAQTGSGKTAAFSLPALEKLKRDRSVQVLVLVPTRELAQQVSEEMTRLGKTKRVVVASVVGGQSSFKQIDTIRRGAQVVVATPGRLLDHLKSGVFKGFAPSMVILDEADEMLDMGFIDDIKKIFQFVPDERQTLLFSATMPPAIRRLGEAILKDPIHVKSSTAHTQNENIAQHLYVVLERERQAALMRLINAESPEKAIIFCRTKRETDDLCHYLTKRGVRAKAIHGDLTQVARMQAVKEIKSGVIQILIGTDVASRGLDISDLTHVFNYHTPENKERYTHRIGRTGRAGKKGVAITLSTPGEIRNHSFYRQHPLNNFAIGTVPSKVEVERSRSASLMTEIESVEISKAAEHFGEVSKDPEAAKDLLSKMYSYLLALQPVDGPDSIGLKAAEVSKLSSSRRREPSIERRSSRQGGGGGRSFSKPRPERSKRPQSRSRRPEDRR